VNLLLSFDDYGHTDHLSGCHNIKEQGFLIMRGYQHWRFGEEAFEIIESFLGFWDPLPVWRFPQEFV